MLRAQWKTWTLATLVLAVLYLSMQIPFLYMYHLLDYGRFEFAKSAGDQFRILGWLESVLLGMIPGGIREVLTAGMIFMALRQLRGAELRLRDIFAVGPFAFRVAALATLEGLASTVAFCCFVIPSVWIEGGLFLSIPIIVDQGRDIVAAVSESRQRVGRSWIGFGLIWLFAVLCGAGLEHFLHDFPVFTFLIIPCTPIMAIFTALHYCYFYPERFVSARPAGQQ